MPFNHFFVFTGRDYKAACEFLKQHYFDFEQGSSQDNPKDSENLHSPDCPKIQSRSSIGDYKMNRMERIFKGLNIMLEPARQVCCIRSTVKQVMERNFPDLLKLTENDTPIVKFIPDFYINSKAGACWVDPKTGDKLIEEHKKAARDPTTSQKKKKDLEKTVNQLIGYRNFSSGDAVEKRLYDALHPILEELSKARNENFVVFHSLNILKFDPESKQDKNEKDFIIVSSKGYIISIECVKKLDRKKFVEKVEQLKGAKNDLETYFKSNILSDDQHWMTSRWSFFPLIYCEENKFPDAASFENHIITGKNNFRKHCVHLACTKDFIGPV